MKFDEEIWLVYKFGKVVSFGGRGFCVFSYLLCEVIIFSEEVVVILVCSCSIESGLIWGWWVFVEFFGVVKYGCFFFNYSW